MARIPRVQQLGLESGPAEQTRGVVNVPVVDASGERAMARVVGDIGKAMSDFGQRLEKADIDRKIVAADRKTREDLDLAYRSIAEDGSIDPTEYEKRYREATDKVIKANAEMVPMGGRDLWKGQAQKWQSDGVIQTRSLQRERQLERAGAEIINEGAEVERMLADPGLDENTVREASSSYLGLIDRQEAEGILTKDRAAQQRAKLGVAVAKSTQDRRTFEIDGMLQANDYKGAKAHLYDNRKDIDGATFRKIEAIITNKQNGFEAQVDADQYWEQGGGYEGALALARKEPDIEKRQKIEANLTTRKAQENAANEERQDKYTDQLWDHVRNGGKIENAPISLLEKFDTPGRFASVQAFQNARDAEKGMSAEKRAEWTAKSGGWKNTVLSSSAMPTDVFMGPVDRWPPRYRGMYQAMTPAHKQDIEDERAKLKDGRGSYETVHKIEGQLMSVAKVVADKKWGLAADANKRPPEADKLISALRLQATSLANLNSTRDLTPGQLNQSVALALKEAGEANSQFMDWQLYAMQFDPESRMAANAPFQRAEDMGRLAGNVFQSDYNKAAADLKAARNGAEPSEEEVYSLMQKRGQY